MAILINYMEELMVKVSIVIPVYNAEKYIKEAIESILNQTFSNFEFIIIDDGSIDATEEIIKSFKDSRIVYIKNEKNLGLIKTLNKGISIARGEFIARMDSDDISMPQRFELQLDVFKKYKGVDIVNVALKKMSEDGTFDVLPKKEVINLKKEWAKLEKNLGGIKDMKDIPDAIFVVDPKKERICIQEAHILGIPLIGIVDTNCDPEELDYVIPGNDDAIRAVKLIVSKMADAVIEANQGESLAEETEEASEAEAE